jgi:hypothetical protein
LLGWFSFADVPSREYQLQLSAISALGGAKYPPIGRPFEREFSLCISSWICGGFFAEFQ